jgi:hypothetical protein
MNVEIRTVAAQFLSDNICFKFSVLVLCSVGLRKTVLLIQAHGPASFFEIRIRPGMQSNDFADTCEISNYNTLTVLCFPLYICVYLIIYSIITLRNTRIRISMKEMRIHFTGAPSFILYSWLLNHNCLKTTLCRSPPFNFSMFG